MQLQLYLCALVALVAHLALAAPSASQQLAPCPTTPHPTLAQHRLAYHTFCTRHFTPSRTLTPNSQLVFTYRLADARAKAVYWVLSAMWEQGGFLGGGSMEIGADTCLGWFRAGEGDEARCREQDGQEGVKGWRAKRGGVRVEARRRRS